MSSVFHQLPESIRNFLQEGYQVDALGQMTLEDLEQCMNEHLIDLEQEGEIARKDVKSRMKEFKKAVKKVRA